MKRKDLIREGEKEKKKKKKKKKKKRNLRGSITSFKRALYFKIASPKAFPEEMIPSFALFCERNGLILCIFLHKGNEEREGKEEERKGRGKEERKRREEKKRGKEEREEERERRKGVKDKPKRCIPPSLMLICC